MNDFYFLKKEMSEIAKNAKIAPKSYECKVTAVNDNASVNVEFKLGEQKTTLKNVLVLCGFNNSVVRPRTDDIGFLIPLLTQMGYTWVFIPCNATAKFANFGLDDKNSLKFENKNLTIKTENACEFASKKINLKAENTCEIKAQKVKIQNDNANLGELVGELIDTLVSLTTNPCVNGSPTTLNPATVAKLNLLKTKFSSLL